jgi:RNA polymerase-binding transcription factor
VPADIDSLLAEREERLRAELAHLTKPTGDAGAISFGKRVGEGTSMAVDRISSVAAHERLQDMLADVRRAQVKLDNGSYGACDVCGEPIAPERLEAMPWATLCVKDAARA